MLQSDLSMLQNDVWNNQYMYGYYYQSDIYMLQNDVSMLQSNVSSKEDATNKSTDVTLSDTTNVKFPTELAVKTYVDSQIASGSTTVGAISSTSNSNGATITSGELNLAPANATNGGIVTTADQTFAGNKTFSDGLRVENKPFLPTKLNQSQINSLTGVEEGMVVYNTDTRKLQLYSVGASDAINDSFTGTFTSQDLYTFEQTFIPPTTGIITAIQLFVKSDIDPTADVFVDFLNVVSGNYLGSGINSLNFANPGSPEWINIPINNIAVTAGQTFKFFVYCNYSPKFGTNSNYFNGGAMPLCCGPSPTMNGDDVMFKILITPTNGTSAYWLNLN
jgi:hypothetical protein